MKLAWTLPLLLLLQACSQTVEVVDTPILKPPKSLIWDCPFPGWEPKTYRDLVQLLLDTEAALDRCNSDKAALRRFYEAMDSADSGVDR